MDRFLRPSLTVLLAPLAAAGFIAGCIFAAISFWNLSAADAVLGGQDLGAFLYCWYLCARWCYFIAAVCWFAAFLAAQIADGISRRTCIIGGGLLAQAATAVVLTESGVGSLAVITFLVGFLFLFSYCDFDRHPKNSSDGNNRRA